MNAQDTFEILCVLIEEGGEPEDVAGAIMVALERHGDDLLAHLDPPVGLQRWLRSHGLSLVTLNEATPPKVWDAIAAEEDGEIGEGHSESPQPMVQVGDYVEYRTAPTGPRGQSQMGSGHVTVIADNRAVIDIGGRVVMIDLETDSLRVVGTQPLSH